jgi:hypothetical protein
MDRLAYRVLAGPQVRLALRCLGLELERRAPKHRALKHREAAVQVAACYGVPDAL